MVDFFNADSDFNLGGGDAATEAALQQMLQQLGLDLRTAMTGQHAKIRDFLTSMKDPSPSKQLSSLSELCEMLSMGADDTVSNTLAREMVPVLVELLNTGANDEIMITACRALVYLMEIMPSSSDVVVSEGAVPVLCAKLMVIEIIDLAEEALLAIEKLSRRNGDALLEGGGLAAVLTYLDFFATASQRSALTSASNMCAEATNTKECYESVLPVMGTLRHLVASGDAKMAERACACCMNLVDVFQGDATKLETIAGSDLVPNLLTNIGHTQESAAVLTTVILTLAQLCNGSPKLAAACFAQNVPDLVYNFVVEEHHSVKAETSTDSPLIAHKGNALAHVPTTTGVVLKHQPPKQVQEFFTLMCHMLPRLPHTDLYRSLGSEGCKGGHAKGDVKANVDYRALARQWIPVLVEVHVSMFNLALQESCLSLLLKILVCVCEEDKKGAHHTQAEQDELSACLSELTASFIASLLKTSRASPIMFGIAMATTLLKRVPNVYMAAFLREGVAHEMQRLKVAESAKESKHKSGDHGSSSKTSGVKKRASVEGSDKQRKWIKRYAGEFMAVLQADSSASSLLSEQSATNAALATLVDALNNAKNGDSQGLRLLRDIITTQHPALSAYEVNNSGLVPALLSYFSVSEPAHRLERLRAFVKLFLTPTRVQSSTARAMSVDADAAVDNYAGIVDGSEGPPAMKTLLRMLNDVLSRVETFPLQIHNVVASDGSPSSFSNHLKVLTQPVKIKLERAAGQSAKLRELKKVVAVEPMASMSAIEDFLWPEVRPKDTITGASESSASNRLGDLARALERMNRNGTDVDDVTTKDSDEVADEPSDDADTDTKADGGSDTEKFAQAEDARGDKADTDASAATKPQTRSQTKARAEVDTKPDTKDDKIPSPPRASARTQSHPLHSTSKTLESRKSKIKKEKPTEPKLDFFVDGHLLDHKTTVLHCLQKYTDFSSREHKVPGTSQMSRGSSQWSSSSNLSGDKEFVITYAIREVDQPDTFSRNALSSVHTPAAPYTSACAASANSSEESSSAGAVIGSRKRALSVDGIRVHGPEDSYLHVFNDVLEWDESDTKQFIITDGATIHTIRILRLVHSVNSRWYLLYPRQEALAMRDQVRILSGSAFKNKTLNAKICRQLIDPLTLASASVPEWCDALCHRCGFLLPMKTRQSYLHATTFGIARALTNLQKQTEQSGGTQKAELRIARIQRAKVKINRDSMLDACKKLMSRYASSHMMLEIEYKNEVGTGLGPTLEFYTLVSREFQADELAMWREKQQTVGLYPAPLPTDIKSSRKRCRMFRTLGQFVGKALWDSKMIDIPFSQTLLRWLLFEEDQFRITTLEDIDPALCRTITALDDVRQQYEVIDTNEALTDEEKEAQINALRLNGATVEDLCLDFTIPGYPDIELIPGGADQTVDIHRLGQYIRLVVKTILVDSVAQQMEAFRSGFDEVISLTALKGFTPNELALMLFGAEEKWDVETLAANTKPDHGYTSESAAVKNLFFIMANYTPDEKRKFLQFITGSPRLPVGGLKSLQPPLTIVRKAPDDSMQPDDFLPSVMTCTNYLKLPDYSSREVMAERLVTAINEGTGSFHMS
ncbi:hypothetical protein SARC_03555 [Sphaeroforma arctica JP610]|uniref:HECT-type E3 ubiquitin transferase n=1 Tax=Sphaeroforma arctica JP610 TaxID=667725 RepID=A0A0L0G7M2_9EUKA|nr:hypothetical protein SARC_03555 [Sphaeroforma arctica JP610]KNC84223.1 hypothetical protein SARC_03555 [Sphaeroforma arctica JP610]|eukprot:XP_014158125.1 hypothetical protein SARC_03555 [Sphaeroforma arctica JP610]